SAFDDLDDLRRASAQIGVSVRVDGDLHFQSSRSICRCARISASMRSASFFESEPTTSLRSRLGRKLSPAPMVSASRATWLKLRPVSRARLLRLRSTCSGMLRIVYWRAFLDMYAMYCKNAYSQRRSRRAERLLLSHLEERGAGGRNRSAIICN